MGPIERAYMTILDRIDGFTSANFWNIVNYTDDIITGIVMMLLAWNGYKLMAGSPAGETANQIFLLMVKYAAIIALFASYPLYEFYVVDWLRELPNSIAALFPYETDTAGLLTPRENIALAKLDNFLTAAVRTATSMMSWTNIPEALLGIIVIIIALMATIFATLQFGIADLGTILFLAIGPFAITAGLFPQSRGIFEGWLRLLVTLVVLKILIIVTLELLLGAFGATAVRVNGEGLASNGFEGILVFLVFTALMYMVLTKIPDFAAQMGGGLALSAAALAGFVSSQIARRTGGAARRGVAGANAARQGAQAVNRNTPPADPNDKEAVAARRRKVMSGALAGAKQGLMPGYTYGGDSNKRRARTVVAQLERQAAARNRTFRKPTPPPKT